MKTRNEYINEDPLGFTKQTATMLVGLGAGKLIPQFQKKHISTQELAELSKDDLMALGADEVLANEMLRQLRSSTRRVNGRILTEELKTNQLIKILTGSNQQLNLVETVVAYARLRLAEKPIDFVINTRKNIRASQALCCAAACMIAEIDELERNFKQLAVEFTVKTQDRSKNSQILAGIAGIGLTAGLVCTLRYAIVGRS